MLARLFLNRLAVNLKLIPFSPTLSRAQTENTKSGNCGGNSGAECTENITSIFLKRKIQFVIWLDILSNK